MSRRAAKIDGNHADVTQALRSQGWLVLSLAALGRGAPDLLATRQGIWHLIEVKQSKGKLTEAQVRFHAVWPVTVIRSIDDALELR